MLPQDGTGPSPFSSILGKVRGKVRGKVGLDEWELPTGCSKPGGKDRLDRRDMSILLGDIKDRALTQFVLQKTFDLSSSNFFLTVVFLTSEAQVDSIVAFTSFFSFRDPFHKLFHCFVGK